MQVGRAHGITSAGNDAASLRVPRCGTHSTCRPVGERVKHEERMNSLELHDEVEFGKSNRKGLSRKARGGGRSPSGRALAERCSAVLTAREARCDAIDRAGEFQLHSRRRGDLKGLGHLQARDSAREQIGICVTTRHS